jgi:hypothetical protein
MRINPYFELDGNRYEIKRTRWLIAEYKKLGEQMPMSAEDKANAITANNLVADAKKFADKANEMWDELYKVTERLYSKVPTIRSLIELNTGIILPPKSKIKSFFKRFLAFFLR